jgi:glucose-6-phosphate isomerase
MTTVLWSENCPVCGKPSAGCIMQMLMAGENLNTEELMYLQKFDNLRNEWDGKKVPVAAITHYDCYQQYKNGEAVLYELRTFNQALNWNVFPFNLLQRLL